MRPFSLRPTPVLLRSQWEKFSQRSRRAYALNQKSEYAITASQALPTFANVTSPRGEWQSIDTSFVDIPDVAEPVPTPIDVARAMHELDHLNDEMAAAFQRQKAQKQQQQQNKSSQRDGSSDSNTTTDLVPLTDKQQQQQALLSTTKDQQQRHNQQQRKSATELALEHMERRTDLASSVRRACERFNTMDQDGFVNLKMLHGELNTGPAYEFSDMRLKRRRAWFALRHTFLSAAPTLFGGGEVLRRLMKLAAMEEEDQKQQQQQDQDQAQQQQKKSSSSSSSSSSGAAVAAAAMQALNESCSVLVWMHTASQFTGKWAERVTWDRRPDSDFEHIDFGIFARTLMQQFAQILALVQQQQRGGEGGDNNAATSITTPLSLENFVALCRICGKYRVDDVTLRSKVLGAATVKSILLSRVDLPPVTAVALGLCCDSSALDLSAHEASSPSVALLLLRCIARDPNLTPFGGLELNFLLELLLQMRQATTTATTTVQQEDEEEALRLFDTLLAAAQRRMRLLMHNNPNPTTIANTGGANAAAEIIDEQQDLNPLSKLAKYRKENSGAASSVIPHLDNYRYIVEGLRPGSVRPADSVRFFKLLTEIAVAKQREQQQRPAKEQQRSSDGEKQEEQDQQQQQQEQVSRICAAWASDVIKRASTRQLSGADRSIDTNECISLLEALATATTAHSTGNSRIPPSQLLRVCGIVSQTLKNRALSLSSLDDAVNALSCIAQLQPTVKAIDPEHEWSCIEALELRILRSTSVTAETAAASTKNSPNILDLTRSAQFARAFTAIGVFPRLAVLEFGAVAVAALLSSSVRGGSDDDKIIANALCVAKCMFAAEEQSMQARSSTTSSAVLTRLVDGICAAAVNQQQQQATFLFDLLSLLSSRVASSENSSVTEPLRRACESLLQQRGQQGKEQQLSRLCSNATLFELVHGLNKLNSGEDVLSQLKMDVVNTLIQRAAVDIEEQQGAATEISPEFTFMELVEIIVLSARLHNNHSSDTNTNFLAVICNFVAQSLIDLKAMLSEQLRFFVESSNGTNQDAFDAAAAELSNVDTRAMAAACRQLLLLESLSCNQQVQAQLADAAIRFVVCCFSVERAKRSVVARAQQHIAGADHDDAFSSSSSATHRRLGFEHGHLMQQWRREAIEADCEVFGRLLRECLTAPAASALGLRAVAEEEWKCARA